MKNLKNKLKIAKLVVLVGATLASGIGCKSEVYTRNCETYQGCNRIETDKISLHFSQYKLTERGLMDEYVALGNPKELKLKTDKSYNLKIKKSFNPFLLSYEERVISANPCKEK